jgi:hypothetical protein
MTETNLLPTHTQLSSMHDFFAGTFKMLLWIFDQEYKWPCSSTDMEQPLLTFSKPQPQQLGMGSRPLES